MPEDQKPWRVRPEVSGGSHFYEGDAHMLDLVDYLVGSLATFNLSATNRTGFYEAEDAVSLSAITDKAIDRFLIFGDKGSIEFPYYDNAVPLVLETIAGDPENAIAHEGVMGGVREEAPLERTEIFTDADTYPGFGQIQDIVNELRGVPGAICTSTLDNAMKTLKITLAARNAR